MQLFSKKEAKELLFLTRYVSKISFQIEEREIAIQYAIFGPPFQKEIYSPRKALGVL